MGSVVVNALLYVIALIIYSFKRRKIDCGFILLATYVFVAVIGLMLFASEPSEWHLRLWPFIYLFVICMMFFRPFFFDSDKLYERLKKPNTKVLSIFCLIYIICSLISIYYGIGSATKNIADAAFNEAYADNAVGDTVYYTNQFERFSKIFAQYLLPVATLTVFYYLTLQNVKPLRIILLALAVILPTFVSSIIIGNRSMIVQLLILVMICYFIFHREISKKRKYIIMIPSIIFIVLVFVLLSSVTISRFGEEGSTSVFYYLGHSMLTFNYGITDTIHSYSNGKYFFSWFIDAFGGNSTIDFSKLGTHFIGAFSTFVGPLYVDFGPIGTFIIALLAPAFLTLFFRHKKHIDIANIYMYAFSLNYITYGVLVVSYGTSLNWMMAFIIYCILKMFK